MDLSGCNSKQKTRKSIDAVYVYRLQVTNSIHMLPIESCMVTVTNRESIRLDDM